jgi:signal recognition particle GTPase
MGAGIILIEWADAEQARKLGGIIDSMTLRERRDPSLIGPSEIRRISAGAAVPPRRVAELLDSFARAAALTKRLTGGAPDDTRESAHDKPPPFWEGN